MLLRVCLKYTYSQIPDNSPMTQYWHPAECPGPPTALKKGSGSMAEQMNSSALCTGSVSGSSRGHRQTGSSVPTRSNAERKVTGELPAAQTWKQNTLCFYMPCLLLSPAFPFAVLPRWNYSNPFSGQTFSNWLDIPEELCCMDIKQKLSKLFLFFQFFLLQPPNSFSKAWHTVNP